MRRPDSWTDPDIQPVIERRVGEVFDVLDGRGLQVPRDRWDAVIDLAIALELPPEDQLAAPRLARDLGLRWRDLVRTRRAA